MLLPASELNDTVIMLNAAIQTYCRKATGAVTNPPAARPVPLLGGGLAAISKNGYFINPVDNKPAFQFGYAYVISCWS